MYVAEFPIQTWGKSLPAGEMLVRVESMSVWDVAGANPGFAIVTHNMPRIFVAKDVLWDSFIG